MLSIYTLIGKRKIAMCPLSDRIAPYWSMQCSLFLWFMEGKLMGNSRPCAFRKCPRRSIISVVYVVCYTCAYYLCANVMSKAYFNKDNNIIGNMSLYENSNGINFNKQTDLNVFFLRSNFPYLYD